MTALDTRLPQDAHVDESDTERPEVPRIEIMRAPSVSSSNMPPKFRRQDWDTGFPEPFNSGKHPVIFAYAEHSSADHVACPDRNTTLPYPGADLSPNACISMNDLLRTNSLASSTRSRRHRLSKHKRTVSYGIISAQHEAMQSVLFGLDTSGGSHTKDGLATPIHSATTAAADTPLSATFTSPRTSKEDNDSFSFKRDDETPPSSPDVGSAPSEKKGLLRKKWRLSRN